LLYSGSTIIINNGVAPTTYIAVATQTNAPIPLIINLAGAHALLKDPA
jgi:hypothetical protein